MKRLIAPIVVLGVLAAACGERGAQPLGPVPTGSPSGVPSITPSPEPIGEPSEEPSGQTMTLEVWFSFTPGGAQEGAGPFLFVTHRTLPYTPAVGRAALTELLRGPTREEKAAGVFTAVPRADLLGLSIENGVATVDLSGDFESKAGGTTAVIMQLAQLVYTITQFDSIRGVDLLLDGRPAGTFDPFVLDRPLTRKDYRDQLPPILVETPGIGERVASPVTVSGSADVFEAVVSIRILDENGNVITAAFTMATCGTGCRGTYEKAVRYSVDRTQLGTIEVFESSAKDGSPMFVVSIPVTLAG